MAADFRFTLIDYTIEPDGISTVIDEPVGWDGITLNLERNQAWTGFFSFFDDVDVQLEFRGKSFQILKAAYDLKRADANVEILIEFSCDALSPYVTIYQGRMTFGKAAAFTCGTDCMFSVGVEDNSCVMMLKNRYDQKVDLAEGKTFDEVCDLTSSSAPIVFTAPDGIQISAPYNAIVPGMAFTITLSTLNNGTYTVDTVVIDGSNNTVITTVEQTIANEGGTPAVLSAGCIRKQQADLTDYTWLNKEILIPTKPIRRINDWEIDPYTQLYTDDVLSGFPVGNVGGYVFSFDWNDEKLTEILDSDRTQYTYGKVDNAPSAIEVFWTDNSGIIQNELNEKLLCTGDFNLQLTLSGNFRLESNDTFQTNAQIFLVHTNPNGSSPAIQIVNLTPNFGGAGITLIDYDFTVNYSGVFSLQEGDKLFVYIGLSNFQYTGGGGGGGNPTDPFEATITLDDGSIYVTNDSFCEPTFAKVYMVNETGSRIAEAVTNECLLVQSDYFGRTDSQPYASEENGCGGLEVLTNGLKIRGINLPDDTEPSLKISMKDWFEGLDAIHNIGMGLEPDAARPGEFLIRVEPKQYFYQDNPIHTCTNLAKVRTRLDIKQLYSTIMIGYREWETESVNGLYDVFTKREFRTSLSSLQNAYDRLCQFIASDNTIEVTRRQYGKQSTDFRYDNDTFILCMKDVDAERCYEDVSFIAANKLILLRDGGDYVLPFYVVGDSITITTTALNNGTYTITGVQWSAAFDGTIIGVQQTLVDEFNVGACLLNNTTTKIVETDIVQGSSAILFPEFCMNLRITPERNMLRHAKSVMQSYVDYAAGKLYFVTGDGNYVAIIDLVDDSCILENGSLKESSNIEAAIVLDISTLTPIYAPELVDIEDPLSWDDWLTINTGNNKYGTVGYQCADGEIKYGYIKMLSLQPREGLGRFTLLPKIDE